MIVFERLAHCAKFQIREYAETTKLMVEIILIAVGLTVLNPSDSIKESTTLALFAAYGLSVVCCYRILPRFGGTSRDLFALTLGRGAFEFSQLISALAFAVAGSMVLGLSVVLHGQAEALLLPKILLQCVFACSVSGAVILFPVALNKAPILPIVFGLAGFLYPVLGEDYRALGMVLSSGDGFYFSKIFLILVALPLVLKRAQERDYIAD